MIPPTENTTRAESKCEKERAEKTKLQAVMADLGIPECTPDGLYEKIQSGMLGKWCVDRETGEMINGTHVTWNESKDPVCPGKLLPPASFYCTTNLYRPSLS